MTWKPIGPEQMDGRVIAAGWELFPSKLAFVKRTPSGWFDVNEWRHTSIPTHYLLGVRPLGEDEPHNEKTVRVVLKAKSDSNGGYLIGGAMKVGDRMLGDPVASMTTLVRVDLPIPEVISASVEDA